MELEAGCVVWSIRRLRRYLFGVFLIFTDHECLQQIRKIGERKPRIQRRMEFLSAYNYRLSYRRGRDNANADFLSRLPILPTAEDISSSSALTDPDDLGVYLIRACGYTTPSCPIPRHWPEPLPDPGLGWATPGKGRLSDAPRSYATKTHDPPNSRHPSNPHQWTASVLHDRQSA